MKILFLAGYAPSLVNFRGPLLQELVALGHDVLACAPEEPATIGAQLEEMGVTYLRAPFERAGMNPVRDFRSILGLVRLLGAERPDAIFAYTIKPVIYGLFAARIVGIPRRYAMITGLGYAFGDSSFRQRVVTRFVKWLYRISLSGCTCVIFQNPDDRDLFVDAGLVESAHTRVVNGSGVDLQHYAPHPVPNTDPPIFVMVARLIREKGVEDFVCAARLVKRSHPSVRFLLAGPLDENPSSVSRSELQGWVDNGDIEYLGALDDIRPAFHMSSVFVLPTYYREGIPRTILEAMAIGRPVVATDTPGCREAVIHGDNGLLIPPRDVRALVRAIMSFVEQPSQIQRMAERGRQLAERKFDVEGVNADIIDSMGIPLSDTQELPRA